MICYSCSVYDIHTFFRARWCKGGKKGFGNCDAVLCQRWVQSRVSYCCVLLWQKRAAACSSGTEAKHWIEWVQINMLKQALSVIVLPCWHLSPSRAYFFLNVCPHLISDFYIVAVRWIRLLHCMKGGGWGWGGGLALTVHLEMNIEKTGPPRHVSYCKCLLWGFIKCQPTLIIHLWDTHFHFKCFITYYPTFVARMMTTALMMILWLVLSEPQIEIVLKSSLSHFQNGEVEKMSQSSNEL